MLDLLRLHHVNATNNGDLTLILHEIDELLSGPALFDLKYRHTLLWIKKRVEENLEISWAETLRSYDADDRNSSDEAIE